MMWHKRKQKKKLKRNNRSLKTNQNFIFDTPDTIRNILMKQFQP